jgi:hypothetical protein
VIYFETDYVGEEYDLEYPRILWNSICRRGTVAVSTEATGFEGVNATTATTWDAWKPTALTATWTLTFDTTETISALAIDTHTLGTSGATATVQSWSGAAWVDVVAGTPTDDEPIAFLFEARSTDRIRLSLTGATVPQISVIHCSEALECPQRVYMGAATPIDMATVTEFSTNRAANGQYLGRSINRVKKANDFTLAHISEYWTRNTLMPFIEDARLYPYFILERPHTRPTALSYRWMDSDIVPQRMGIRSLMTVSL